jgi:hypothetical protein
MGSCTREWVSPPRVSTVMQSRFELPIDKVTRSTPIGAPHCAKEDVWYRGMLIPKDATIISQCTSYF